MEKWKKICFQALFYANLIGAVLGFIFWYGKKLISKPIYLWPFIPQSPLYALFFVISVLLIIYLIKSNLFQFITVSGLMKYGILTVLNQSYLIMTLPDYKVDIGVIYLILSHVVMLAEAFLLFGYFDVKKRTFLIVSALIWFSLSDLVFITNFIRTALIKNFFLIEFFLVLTTVVTPFLVYFLAKHIRKPMIDLRAVFSS